MIHAYHCYLALQKRIKELAEIKSCSYAHKGTKFAEPFAEIWFKTITPTERQRNVQRYKIEAVLSLHTQNMANVNEALGKHLTVLQLIFEKLHGWACNEDYVILDGNQETLINTITRGKTNMPEHIEGIMESQTVFEFETVDTTYPPEMVRKLLEIGIVQGEFVTSI